MAKKGKKDSSDDSDSAKKTKANTPPSRSLISQIFNKGKKAEKG
jgi:hypothetical protein